MLFLAEGELYLKLLESKNMKASIYNQEGKEIEKSEIESSIFDLELNDDLVHQVVVSQMSNRRQGSAHTKSRGDVSGGGKKPWRQKGTDRARHGSIRSPLWRGGGVTFGPKNIKDYKKIIPKEMKRKALFMALSAKAKDRELFVIDSLKVKDHKTKTVKKIIDSFNFSGSILIVLPSYDKNIVLGSQNLVKVETMPAKNITALEILSFKNIVLTKEAISVIKEIFVK